MTLSGMPDCACSVRRIKKSLDDVFVRIWCRLRLLSNFGWVATMLHP